jgi:hypothetical protein
MSYLQTNPYVLNLVPLFNVADPTNGDATLTASQLTLLAGMIDTTTNTIKADVIEAFTPDGVVTLQGNYNVVGSFSVNDVQIGPNLDGSNFINGTTVNISTGTTGLVLTNTVSSTAAAIDFIVGSDPVFQIDGLGRALYQGDGVSSNVNRFWVSSAVLHADRAAIGFGGASNISSIFNVYNGDAYFDRNVFCRSTITCNTLVQTSDRRLKSDIYPIEGALSTLRMLQGVNYTLGGGANSGFIAQDVAEVLPNAVRSVSGEMLGIEYSQIIPVLVEAVKSLTARVEELTERLEELEVRAG